MSGKRKNSSRGNSRIQRQASNMFADFGTSIKANPMNFAGRSLILAVCALGLSAIFVLPAFSVETPFQEAIEHGDKDFYTLDTTASAGMGTLLTIDYNGRQKNFWTSAAIVEDVLSENDLSIPFNYSVYPELDAAISTAMTIYIGPVINTISQVDEHFEFERVIKEDPASIKGTERTLQAGQNGEYRTTYLIQTIAGHEISRKEFVKYTITALKDEIVSIGTMALPDPETFSLTANEARALAKEMIGDEVQFACLDSLWEKESKWNVHASNGASGAYGIPQAYPGSKMASAGADWQDNAETQIKWGLNYIETRYGNACSAWAYFLKNMSY